ncbi:MAG: V-type ATPase subunit [Treponema sp.]|jgi:vacuolar-type H+-ATPase subunit C/Vma6|nr:V-type ATPase subunit [Treponema sp.]
MPGMGERSYAYAKACGIIGKSFVGKRSEPLKAVSRLSDLDRLVFPGSSKEIPEKKLLLDLEERIINREINAVISVVNSFKKTPDFFSLLIRGYEYTDVKNAVNAAPGSAKPVFTGIGRFGTVNFSAWPDFSAMFRGTEFEYLLDEKGELDRSKSGTEIQAGLDRGYYKALWNAMLKLSLKDRRSCRHILGEEISLKNAAWALRLRSYYKMKSDQIAPHLIDISSPVRGGKISLAEDALSLLELPLDNRASWDKWKRSRFLNPDTLNWKADPRFFQNACARYLYRLARQSFRAAPLSLDSVFCFIKIKQFEEDILTSISEGMGMGISSQDVYSLMGANP